MTKRVTSNAKSVLYSTAEKIYLFLLLTLAPMLLQEKSDSTNFAC